MSFSRSISGSPRASRRSRPSASLGHAPDSAAPHTALPPPLLNQSLQCLHLPCRTQHCPLAWLSNLLSFSLPSFYLRLQMLAWGCLRWPLKISHLTLNLPLLLFPINGQGLIHAWGCLRKQLRPLPHFLLPLPTCFLKHRGLIRAWGCLRKWLWPLYIFLLTLLSNQLGDVSKHFTSPITCHFLIFLSSQLRHLFPTAIPLRISKPDLLKVT